MFVLPFFENFEHVESNCLNHSSKGCQGFRFKADTPRSNRGALKAWWKHTFPTRWSAQPWRDLMGFGGWLMPWDAIMAISAEFHGSWSINIDIPPQKNGSGTSSNMNPWIFGGPAHLTIGEYRLASILPGNEYFNSRYFHVLATTSYQPMANCWHGWFRSRDSRNYRGDCHGHLYPNKSKTAEQKNSS